MHRKFSTRWHGVASIQKQVNKDLLELSRVSIYRREREIKVRLHSDIIQFKLVTQQSKTVFDELIDVQILEFAVV